MSNQYYGKFPLFTKTVLSPEQDIYQLFVVGNKDFF